VVHRAKDKETGRGRLLKWCTGETGRGRLIKWCTGLRIRKQVRGGAYRDR
jgi:hypothetical protein